MPCVPIFQHQRRRSAPAARIEPTPSLPGPRQPVWIAAGPPDCLMHLTDKTGRASMRRASTTTIVDPAWADAEVVSIVCHETRIGSEIAGGKSRTLSS